MGKIKKHPYSGKAGTERDFIKLVDELARHRRHGEVLNDFLEMAYCAVAKKTHFPTSPQAEALEERYMAVVRRAKDDAYIRRMPEMLGIVAAGVQEHGDFIGKCAAEIGGLNEYLGQYFTPFEVCRLMARMSMGEVEPILESQGWISVHEPAVGGGAQIIAAAEYLEELGYDPATSMYVEAMDISNTAFQMAYLQFSLRGIPAKVTRGNAISLEQWEVQFTPPMELFLDEHKDSWLEWRRTSVFKPDPAQPEQPLLIQAPLPTPAKTQKEMPPKKPATAGSMQLSMF
jgi:hypothetical protein